MQKSTIPSLDFSKFEKHLASLAECPREAEQSLAELDKAFAKHENALREWLAQAEAARRKLAALGECAVG